MNKELVATLAEKAKNSVPQGLNPDQWIEVYNTKLIQYVIQECIDIVNKRKDAAIDAEWLVDEAMSNAVWDIEEHFGVEE